MAEKPVIVLTPAQFADPAFREGFPGAEIVEAKPVCTCQSYGHLHRWDCPLTPTVTLEEVMAMGEGRTLEEVRAMAETPEEKLLRVMTPHLEAMSDEALDEAVRKTEEILAMAEKPKERGLDEPVEKSVKEPPVKGPRPPCTPGCTEDHVHVK